MKRQTFSLIGILIILTLVFTIGIQLYRNIQNYSLNQRQLQSDIQLCLDNSVENYYAELAKSDVLPFTDKPFSKNKTTFRITSPDSIAMHFRQRTADREIIHRIESGKVVAHIDSLLKGGTPYAPVNVFKIDTLKNIEVDRISHINVIKNQLSADSLKNLRQLTSRIIISLTRDTLDFEKLNGYLQEELDRQKISINYGLLHYNRDSVAGSFNKAQLEQMPFKTVSKSTFLPQAQRLEMHFENSALAILERGLSDILVSLLFLLVIGGALGYLYQTIRSQKELAEIKNDLISNITHEFKTPIATVAVALEGIEHFNTANDPQKTQKYLAISNLQLQKLHTMVEKLLETATLDSDRLYLQKEPVTLQTMLQQLVEKYQALADGKEIDLQIPVSPISIEADPFHLENALSNLIDNAIKYGGDQIGVQLQQDGKTIITVTDNGGFIGPDQKEKVFEQFYRIPTGNLHDVKGFGIGLFYTRKIIEKHGGTIVLESGHQQTTFKLTLA